MGRRELLGLLVDAVDAELDAALEVRRELRRCPETAWREQRTSATIERALGPATRVADTGLLVRVGEPVSAVAVRAELDALEVDGQVLHACGHDAHMAALVALVRAAGRVEDELPVGLLAVFQPSEEAYPSGAARLVAEGVLAGGIRAVVAAHAHPDVEWNRVRCDAGVVNAAADVLDVEMVGAAGHVAYRENARNPIAPLAAFVAQLETAAAAGELPGGTTAAVSGVRAGGADNVLPRTASATVALRALDSAARARLRRQVETAAADMAQAHACEVRVTLTEGEPELVNDAHLSERAADLFQRVGLGREPGAPSFGSDDFAYFGAVAPLLMTFVGLAGAPGFRGVGLHDPRFEVPDEAVRPIALALAVGFCAVAAYEVGSA
jgi:amidohydrolase